MSDVNMSDAIETGTTEEQAATEPTDKPTRAPKADPTKPCYCSFFEVGKFDGETVGTEDEEIFTTGCDLTTKRQFAQGHDARLVSFLVDGHFDGYDIRKVVDGTGVGFNTPAEAAYTASDALGLKAEKATENRRMKIETVDARKAEREAAKVAKAAEKEKAKADKAAAKELAAAEKAANKPAPQAEVVAGSSEGDLPVLADGQARIKVGRWEYTADIDPETGVATYLDGKGDEATIERDGYRLLDA